MCLMNVLNCIYGFHGVSGLAPYFIGMIIFCLRFSLLFGYLCSHFTFSHVLPVSWIIFLGSCFICFGNLLFKTGGRYD